MRTAFALICLAAVGCVPRETGSELVTPSPFQPRGKETVQTQVSYGPAAPEITARVEEVGRKLILCNPQISVRPQFRAVGNPQPQVFHQGTKEVVVSDALVKLCPTENELAAVLALELAKMTSEIAMLTRPNVGRPNPPPNLQIGDGNGYGPGSGDQVYMAELGNYEKQRREQIGALRGGPNPTALAKTYLAKSCFQPQAIENVVPWLKQYTPEVSVQKRLKPSTDG